MEKLIDSIQTITWSNTTRARSTFLTAVSNNEDGYRMVNYDAQGVLGIQEQQNLIQELVSKNKQLVFELERLEKRDTQFFKRLSALEEILHPKVT